MNQHRRSAVALRHVAFEDLGLLAPLLEEPALSARARNELRAVETEIKYAGYLDQQTKAIERLKKSEQRVIPEWFGGGTLPRRELHEAAEQLTASQAGLIVVGEPTIEKGLDKALTKAARVVKHTVEATTDEITSELQEALKS